MQLSSYANGDGTSIKVSVPELAKALGWSPSTIKRRLRELYFLGLMTNGAIDGYYHTRVRAIDIQKVINPTEGTGSDSQGNRVRFAAKSPTGTGSDRQGTGSDRQGTGSDRHTCQRLPSYIPSKKTATPPDKSVVGLGLGVGDESTRLISQESTATPKGNPSPMPDSTRQFYVKGVGLTEGTSYQDAENRVREKREAYLMRKGGE